VHHIIPRDPSGDWRGALMAVQFGDARSRVPFASPRLTSLPRYRSQTSTRARETRITDRSHAGPLPFSQRTPCAPLTAQQLSTTYECEYPQADLMLPTRYQQIPQKPHSSSRRNWPIAEPCGSSLARFERHASITSHGFDGIRALHQIAPSCNVLHTTDAGIISRGSACPRVSQAEKLRPTRGLPFFGRLRPTAVQCGGTRC